MVSVIGEMKVLIKLLTLTVRERFEIFVWNVVWWFLWDKSRGSSLIFDGLAKLLSSPVYNTYVCIKVFENFMKNKSLTFYLIQYDLNKVRVLIQHEL